jgi:hypothetical protein
VRIRRHLVALLALAGVARADAPPVVIAPFKSRCFDAAELAERVRTSAPDLAVRVGGAASGAHQLVRVTTDGAGVTVQVTARNAAGRIVGSERRSVPGGDDCPTLLDTAALIVARAATPLHSLRPSEPPKPVERPSKPEPVAKPPEPPPPPVEKPPPPVEKPPPPVEKPEPLPPPPVEKPPPPPREVVKPPKPERPPSAATATVILPPPIPPRRHAELELRAAWAFAVDPIGDQRPSKALGELAVGYAWPRAGLTLRAGVNDDFGVSTGDGVSLDLRRLPFSLEAHVDVRVRGGAFRFSLGPNLMLWLITTQGLEHVPLRTLVEPGATARVAYRLELGRVVLSIGVAADAQFTAHAIGLGQYGVLAHTPWVQITPYVAAGAQIF